MSLPTGFHWQLGPFDNEDEPSLLALSGNCVLRLVRRGDGSWFAVLNAYEVENCYRAVRDCSSFISARIGAEIWASLHEDRLRAAVAGLLGSNLELNSDG
jgi:hypothetical protein